MKTEGIGCLLKLGEDAFRLSSDFQQEVERMVTNFFLPNPSCSIIGTTQPGMLSSLFGGKRSQNGFLDSTKHILL